MSVFASAEASVALSSSRLIPRISRASSACVSAAVTCTQLFVSEYLIPLDLGTPGTGDHVQSVVSPPIRSSGACPGVRLRISCSNTGLIACGSLPA